MNIEPQETVRTALDGAIARLRRAGVEEADQKAEWAMSRALDCPRLELPLRGKNPLPSKAAYQFELWTERLARGEPLQYVLGETAFMGLTLKVDARALIPRPETEEFTETVLEHPTLWRAGRSPVIADIGTGSGCIALALAARRPEGQYRATDLSATALSLARENTERLGMTDRVKLMVGDLLEPFPPGSLNAVVCNPPYVPTADWERLPRQIRDFEPRLALDGGPDGLSIIRRLIPAAFTSLATGGILFLEIGSGQSGPVAALLAAGGFRQIGLRRDYRGHDRVVWGEKS